MVMTRVEEDQEEDVEGGRKRVWRGEGSRGQGQEGLGRRKAS